MVGVSGLALIGQVAIGLQKDNVLVIDLAIVSRWKAYLNAVFKAVKLSEQSSQLARNPIKTSRGGEVGVHRGAIC